MASPCHLPPRGKVLRFGIHANTETPCRIFGSCRVFGVWFQVIFRLFSPGASSAQAVHDGADHDAGGCREQNDPQCEITAVAGLGGMLSAQLGDLLRLGIVADRAGAFFFALGRLGGLLCYLPVAEPVGLPVLLIVAAAALVPVVVLVELQLIGVGGVGVGKAHPVKRSGIKVQIVPAVLLLADCPEDVYAIHAIFLIQTQAPHRVVIGPAFLLAVVLPDERALVEHIVEPFLGGGDGHGAAVAVPTNFEECRCSADIHQFCPPGDDLNQLFDILEELK